MANDGWVKITSHTFNGSISTLTLSAIPQTYDHLIIMATFGGVSSTYGYFNGTNTYPVTWTTMYANGSYNVATINSMDPTLSYFYSYGANGASNRASAQWWTIPFYSKSDNYKSIIIHSNSSLSSGNEFGGMWTGTFGTQSPITSITINAGDVWTSGCGISLYGMVAK